MTDQTTDAIATAIRAHVLDECDGAYLTDWVLIAAGAMPDDPDATTYVIESSDGPFHHRVGLVEYLKKRTDKLFDDEGEQ